MCATTPSSSQVAMYRGQRHSRPVPHNHQKKDSEATEYKGTLLIHDLWKNGGYSVHDMHVMNSDAKSYLAKKPKKCLH